MKGLPQISKAEAFRVRRWDVVMLGAALPGLVAAARLGQRGLRVLILEEGGAADDLAREPFLLVDGEPEGILAECLRALGVPLIEQRRFTSEEVALQVCDAERRVDLGHGTLTAEEWASWGLASLDEARGYLRALEEAAVVERGALLECQLSQRTTRRAREVLAGGRRDPARGWPTDLDAAPPALREVLDAPLRALSNLGAQAPSPEARARLLGGLLHGGVSMGGGDGFLRGLLRRRIETLYGECRIVEGPLRLVSVSNQPGIAVAGSKEIWTGRTLVVNAPRAAIASAAEDPVPDLLEAPPVRWRRHTLHYRGPLEQLPPSMADRVVWRDPESDIGVALRVFRGKRRADGFDLLGSVVLPADAEDPEVLTRTRVERALKDLLPFSEGVLERCSLPTRRWDSDAWLADPERGGWPDEPELRLSRNPSVYTLERPPVAGLGGEGELWLGWRAGDAIAAELA